jgi:hypothetical protein
LTWVAVTRQVPDTLVGTLNTTPLTEHPVAVPLVALKVTGPVPEPPVTASEMVVLIAAAAGVTTRGDVGVVSVELDIM